MHDLLVKLYAVESRPAIRRGEDLEGCLRCVRGSSKRGSRRQDVKREVHVSCVRIMFAVFILYVGTHRKVDDRFGTIQMMS